MFRRSSLVTKLTLLLSIGVVVLAACAPAGAATPAAQSSRTLIVSAIPDQDPEKLQRLYGLLATYLSKELGVPVEYKPVTDYTASVTAFKVGDLDLVWYGGLTGVQARLQVPGAEAIVQRDIDETFHSVFIANTSSGLKPIEDVSGLQELKGHTFTFGSESSTSGRLMPQYYLKQAGLSLNDFKGEAGFSGSHDATIKLVEAGTYDAGPVNEQVWDSRVQSGDVDRSKVVVLWRTPAYYDYHWVVNPNVTRDFGAGFVDKIKAAYLPFSMAYPQRYVIDPSIIGTPEADKAKAACKYDAVDLGMKEETVNLKIGAVVWATGWRPYDAAKIQLSRRRIDRTGYLSDVTVDTQPVQGSSDQVDVDFTVQEKPTGALLLGAGFSSVDKIIISASITQPNVFGSGKYLSLQVNSGSVNKTYSLSYVNPYYTVDGISQGFDIYKRDVDASTLLVGAYQTKTLGAGIKFGYPLSEADSVSIGFNAEDVKLTTYATSPFVYTDFAAKFGDKYTYGATTLGWAHDTRDSVIIPTSGVLSRASLELGGGDLEYYKFNFAHQWLKPLSRQYTLRLAGTLGYAGGMGNKPLPFFKNYYAGGPDTVRGYATYSLGPRDPLNNALGGSREVVGTAEILFPMPGAQNDKSLRLSAFLDAGQVYGEGEKVSLSALRYSTGLGLNWSSPFGPLRLSLGIPLNRKPGDNVQRLQFTFGTAF